jgi:hydrogenase/urease accessory protein HupE
MVLSVLLWPSTAAAHLVTTGLGPVYDGIGHLLLTPEDLIPVLALALFAGMRGVEPGRQALFFLPIAWLSGGLIGLQFEGLQVDYIPALSFLIIGALIAADLRIPANAVTALAIILGLMHGFFNGVALQQGAGALGLIGIMATLFVLLAIISSFIITLKQPWARIVIRVTGSWVVASGILMLGWLIRGSS